MKSNTYAALFAAAAVTLAVTSCHKEPVRPMDQQQPEIQRVPVAEGIRSIGSWTGTGTSWIDYFKTFPSWAQQPDVFGSYGPSSGSSSIRAYGASGNHEAYAYRDGSLVMLNDDDMNVNIVTLGGSNFTYNIHELEIDPSTQEVYCILQASLGGAVQIYHIDRFTGAATYMGNLRAAGSQTTGTFTFVPNGSGGYDLLHVYENNTIPATSAVMKYWTISGTTTLTAGNTYSFTVPIIPGGGSLNMCYGNGRVYIARDSGDLYEITTLPTSSPVTTSPAVSVESDANFDNKYDFGFWSI